MEYVVVDIEDCGLSVYDEDRDSPRQFVTEASTMGLKPGQRPEAVVLLDHKAQTATYFAGRRQLVGLGESAGDVYYANAKAGKRSEELHVVND